MLTTSEGQKIPNHTNTWGDKTAPIIRGKNWKIPNHERDTAKRWCTRKCLALTCPPEKLPENCIILKKKSWRQGGQAPRAPWTRQCYPDDGGPAWPSHLRIWNYMSHLACWSKKMLLVAGLLRRRNRFKTPGPNFCPGPVISIPNLRLPLMWYDIWSPPILWKARSRNFFQDQEFKRSTLYVVQNSVSFLALFHCGSEISQLVHVSMTFRKGFRKVPKRPGGGPSAGSRLIRKWKIRIPG